MLTLSKSLLVGIWSLKFPLYNAPELTKINIYKSILVLSRWAPIRISIWFGVAQLPWGVFRKKKTVVSWFLIKQKSWTKVPAFMFLLLGSCKCQCVIWSRSAFCIPYISQEWALRLMARRSNSDGVVTKNVACVASEEIKSSRVTHHWDGDH